MNWDEETLQQKLKDNPDLKIATHVDTRLCVVNESPIKKRSKYNVSAREDRTYNGITYHSKKEKDYYVNVLEPKLKSGELTIVLRQVTFYIGNDPVTKYVADFYTMRLWANYYWDIEVIEVKPKSEKAWGPGAKRKLKLFKSKYPHLRLVIV